MPIPLFTASEKPSNTETLSPSLKETVTSTPLTSCPPQGSPSEQRHPSTPGHQEAVAVAAAAAASGPGAAASAGREMTREEREEADRLYEERIEEEYAKREGGA